MKYVLLLIPFMIMVVVSFLLGGVFYLWKFSYRDFRHGTSYINENVYKFTDWFKTNNPKPRFNTY